MAPLPIDVCERGMHAPLRVPHAEKGRKVILLRIARVPPHAREVEFWPKPPVADDEPGVLTCQRPELGPNAEVLEPHRREHRLVSTRGPSVVGSNLVVEDFDEALAGVDEGAVGEVEGMKGDARGGEKDEHVVGTVVDEGACE